MRPLIPARFIVLPSCGSSPARGPDGPLQTAVVFHAENARGDSCVSGARPARGGDGAGTAARAGTPCPADGMPGRAALAPSAHDQPRAPPLWGKPGRDGSMCAWPIALAQARGRPAPSLLLLAPGRRSPARSPSPSPAENKKPRLYSPNCCIVRHRGAAGVEPLTRRNTGAGSLSYQRAAGAPRSRAVSPLNRFGGQCGENKGPVGPPGRAPGDGPAGAAADGTQRPDAAGQPWARGWGRPGGSRHPVWLSSGVLRGGLVPGLV